MKLKVYFLLAAILLEGATTLFAGPRSQPGSVARAKLIAVKVAGTSRYTEKEILGASGLELGQVAGEGDFTEAARRLGDTGMFSDVVFSYSYSGAGTRLDFTLTDADPKKFVPVVFNNFVWFNDADLLRDVQKRVPLFKQLLPVAGTLPDRVSDALQALLSEKQLPGHVDYMREGKQDGGDLTAISYRVTDVEIRIRNCEFPGAPPDLAQSLAAAANKLAGVPYDRFSLVSVARLDFLPVFLKRGYLKAEFSSSDAKVVPKSSSEESLADVEVDAILPVAPGTVYTTTSVAWTGNTALKTAELQDLIHLPVGAPADALRLTSDLDNVRDLYHSRGFMAANIQAEPALDESKSTVSYTLQVSEGDQYKMGELEIVGLDTQATAHLQGAWTLREGDAFDGTYAKKFLQQTNRFLPGGVGWNVSVHESINAKDKTVDVTLRYRPK